MLAVHSPDPGLVSRLEGALPPDRRRWATTEPERFARPPETPEAAVVAADDPSPDFFARLREWRQAWPSVPVVLVVPRTGGAVRGLKDVVVEELVWTSRLEEEIGPAVRRAVVRGALREAAREVRDDPAVPAPLAEALSLALRRDPPPTSVQQLAAEVGKDRRTLWYHWRNTVGAGTEMTLKEFLDWVLVLRAASAKQQDRTWRSVAGEMDVHPRTLRRAARRRLGVRLHPLGAAEGDRALVRFRSTVLPKVTGPRA